MEQWKQIDDTNYSVSNLGQVRNDTKNTILTPRQHTVGYLAVCLGRRQQSLIHRLVANAFLENPLEEGLVVDHINRIKTDNRACNLRWATKSQNAQNSNYNHISYLVSITRQDVKFRKSFKSLKEAEEYRDTILREYPIFK
jgi:hypothetical protein